MAKNSKHKCGNRYGGNDTARKEARRDTYRRSAAKIRKNGKSIFQNIFNNGGTNTQVGGNSTVNNNSCHDDAEQRGNLDALDQNAIVLTNMKPNLTNHYLVRSHQRGVLLSQAKKCLLNGSLDDRENPSNPNSVRYHYGGLTLVTNGTDHNKFITVFWQDGSRNQIARPPSEPQYVEGDDPMHYTIKVEDRTMYFVAEKAHKLEYLKGQYDDLERENDYLNFETLYQDRRFEDLKYVSAFLLGEDFDLLQEEFGEVQDETNKEKRKWTNVFDNLRRNKRRRVQ